MNIEEVEKRIVELEKKGGIAFQERQKLSEEIQILSEELENQVNRLSEVIDEPHPPELVGEVVSGPDLENPSKGLFPLFTAEQNGKLTGDRMNFSFGNGNEHSGLDAGGWGFTVPFDLTIKNLTLGSRVSADSNGNEVMLVTNENPTKSKTFNKTDITIGLGKGQRNTIKDVDLFVKSGTVLNILTVNPGGDDLVVTAWAKLS